MRKRQTKRQIQQRAELRELLQMAKELLRDVLQRKEDGSGVISEMDSKKVDSISKIISALNSLYRLIMEDEGLYTDYAERSMRMQEMKLEIQLLKSSDEVELVEDAVS